MPIPLTPFEYRSLLYGPRTDVLDVLRFEMPRDMSGMFGVELELDWRHKVQAQTALVTAYSQTPCFIAKQDGSICGPELVSLPMSKEEHLTYIETLKDSGALNNLQATRRDGIHIHIDRLTCASEEVQRRLILLLNAPLMQRFYDQLFRRRANNYCTRGWHRHISTGDAIQRANNELRCTDKYRAVNFMNSNTIEFRMFKATTSVAAYMRTIETVELLLAYVRHNVASASTSFFFENSCQPRRLVRFLHTQRNEMPLLARWVRTSATFAEWRRPPAAAPAARPEEHDAAPRFQTVLETTLAAGEGVMDPTRYINLPITLPPTQELTPPPVESQRRGLSSRTPAPTHMEVVRALQTMDLEAYILWYTTRCDNRFVSARGQVRETNRDLRWQAMYHRRLVRRFLTVARPDTVTGTATAPNRVVVGNPVDMDADFVALERRVLEAHNIASLPLYEIARSI